MPVGSVDPTWLQNAHTYLNPLLVGALGALILLIAAVWNRWFAGLEKQQDGKYQELKASVEQLEGKVETLHTAYWETKEQLNAHMTEIKIQLATINAHLAGIPERLHDATTRLTKMEARYPEDKRS